MEIEINKSLVQKLRESGASGQSPISLDQLNKLTNLLTNKKAQAIKLGKDCFIVFSELERIEFTVIDFRSVKDLEFIPSSELTYIDATKEEVKYLRFIFNEFFQGEKFTRLTRFFATTLPLAIINVLVYFYSTYEAMQETFLGLLTGISIFIAIFALFTISHDSLHRKKLMLFERGKLGYYFSIDKHVTRTGISAIIFSIFGIVTSGSEVGTRKLYVNMSTQSVILVVLLNLSFVGVFIILRSLLEFYINRPGSFIMGDLKKESFKKFTKDRVV